MAENPRDWLTLLHAPGVGPVRFRRLLERYGNPAAVLQADRADLEQLGLDRKAVDWLRKPDEALLEADLAWLQGPAHRLLNLADPLYPSLLAGIPDPPPLLFVIGDPELLARPQLAIVGSRNPTEGGRRTAREFARFLASAGLTITSGMAGGIDAASHQGALEGGNTVAVLGTGPDRIYPAANQELAHRIRAQGVLVTEFPPGTRVRKENFPRRNRIISGLSLGTLVVEAAARSGSLITARLAVEQGREVFAIPGSIHNPLARGCHALLRQGAKLVETAGDIIEELGPLFATLQLEGPGNAFIRGAPGGPQLDEDYLKLLDCLGHDPVTPDLLMQCSGFTADVVSSMLLMLELEGLVVSMPGGRYSRTAAVESSAS